MTSRPSTSGIPTTLLFCFLKNSYYNETTSRARQRPALSFLEIDMETKTSIVAEPELIAEEYRSALDAFLNSIRRECAEARCDYRFTTTDAPLEPLLRDFLTARGTKAKH